MNGSNHYQADWTEGVYQEKSEIAGMADNIGNLGDINGYDQQNEHN